MSAFLQHVYHLLQARLSQPGQAGPDETRRGLEQYRLYAFFRPNPGQSYAVFGSVGQDSFVTEKVGAIVVATGYQLYSIGKAQPAGLKGYGEYGYGEIPDVIDGLQFERLASASGPTGGQILRPSDGKEPKRIVFLQCVGSRDPAKGIEYCSKICCMYVAKHTMLYRHKVHDGQAYVFYMDVRAAGKGYEEFARRAVEEDGAVYLRGRVSKLERSGETIKVYGFDTLSGEAMVLDADMVVLATAMRPQPGVEALAQKLSVSYDGHGFLNEAHPKLRPVETNTAGVFVAGACQAPRDIPDSVAMASAAASKALGLLSREELEREPTVALVDERVCAGCFHCERVCAYGAVERQEVRDRQGRVVKVVGFVASDPSFTGQPGVVNGASELLGQLFGDAGVHARSAVGVAVLPLDAPVEIELVVELV